MHGHFGFPGQWLYAYGMALIIPTLIENFSKSMLMDIIVICGGSG